MLRFESAPDPVFRAILHDCLEWTCDDLEYFTETYRPSKGELRERDEFYRATYPRMARFFGRKEALKPHPDELRMIPWTEPGWEAGDEMTGPESGRVPVYPPTDADDPVEID
jgi:hypothetical protein